MEKLEKLRREQGFQPAELQIQPDKPEMDDQPRDRGVEIIDTDKEDPRKRGEVKPTTLYFK